MSTCMRCGKEIADGSSFCNDCKTVVNPVENVQPTYVQQYQQANPVQSTPVQPTPVQPNPAQQQYAPPPQQPNMNYQQQPNMNYQQPYQQQPNMNYQQPYQQPGMNYQQPYMGYPQPEQPKKTYGALICGIIGIVFSFLFALVGHAASITGIVLGAKEKKTQGSSAGLIVSIIGEVLSVISSLIGLVSMLSLFL